MKPKVIVLICLLALLSTVAMADTVTSSYNAGTDTWTYDVTFTNSTRYFFRVYLDPNMNINYINSIGNDGGFGDPISLGSYVWTEPDPDTTLTYLEWSRGASTDLSVQFYYSDAHDTTVNAPHMMDLVTHAGPLLHNPASHSGAPSTQILSFGGANYFTQTMDKVAITPEPGTVTLLAFGLLGLAGVVRRRYGT